MVRSVAAVVVLLALALSGGMLINSRVGAALDEIRQTRVAIDVQDSLRRGRARDGDLTIVKETKSAKYHFLNKRSYLVHTSSTAREGTVLRGEVEFDKARADRHSEARRKQSALTALLPDGRWRVTLAEDMRTAELVANPPLVPFRAPWTTVLIGLLVGATLGIVLRLKAPPLLAFGIGAVTLAAALLFATNQAFADASIAATTYLAEGGRKAPIVQLPAQVALASVAGLCVLGLGLVGLVASSLGERASQSILRDRHAYAALGPAMLGLGVLVGIPFIFGMALSLFHHQHGTFTFVGIQNFIDIMSSDGESFWRPRTLPYSLVMTIVWTTSNVTLHLGIGLALALVLKAHSTSLTRFYRDWLIVPWAVPSYLTALIWKSMFDAEVGVVNRILGLEGMSWMHSTGTAFAANLVTNVWLGVPFMMVVCLGALTSIPTDLYEAAEVDGASRWQQLRQITIPLLKPALLPALILGSIWTFNKFEVIYLVSEGKPDGATEILVTESYRWAFTRGLAQGGAYGYAAAYSVIIFVVLLLYSWMTSRVSRAAEEALR